jgi:glycosidase
MPWLRGDMLDSITNYKFSNALRDYFAINSISTKNFKDLICNNSISYPKNVSKVLLNSLDSHDTKRFFSDCDNNLKKLKLAVVFQMTYIGIPCIYYGDEVPLTGGSDYKARKCMSWSSKDELFYFYKSLIKLRKENEIFTNGDFKFIDTNDNLLVYSRTYNKNKLLVIINNSKDRKTVKEINLNPYSFKLYINSKEICLEEV